MPNGRCCASGHSRWKRSRENESAREAAHEVTQISRCRDITADDTERLAKSGLGNSGSKRQSVTSASIKDADTKALEGDLSANLGMKVSVDHNAGQENGQITIKYKTLDDLDNLCRILSASN